jgi:drug/metabolite transporter (DMT)-like permease
LAIALAALSALCFAAGLLTARVGLRMLDARSGAAISVPTAALLFLLLAPFAIDAGGIDTRALLLFAAVGVFFPALVTLLTFRSNLLLGPTITSAVAGTSPLFAILAAAVVLGEQVPARAAVAALGVVAGIALLSWRRTASPGAIAGTALVWPVAGAVVRGVAQVGAKAGLMLWASPFAACLIGYVMSSATVIAADRLRRARPGRPFAATGLLNGLAVLAMYTALGAAPVWVVAPIVASYPLATAILGAVFLHDEKPSPQAVAGAIVTVAAIAYLVGAHDAA